MGIGKTISKGFKSIGKKVKHTTKKIGKFVTSDGFKTGAKVAAGVAAAAALAFGGYKAKQEIEAKKSYAKQVKDDVEPVIDIARWFGRGIRETKKRVGDAGDAVGEFLAPGVTREKQKADQSVAGKALTAVSETLNKERASGIIENVGAFVGQNDKLTSGQAKKATEAKEKIVSEIKERKAKLIRAEQNNVMDNVVDAIMGRAPTIADPGEETKGVASRLWSWFAPDPDLDHYGV